MKIVLAVDASKGSEAVIEEVAVRRWPDGTRFEVLTVADTAHLPSSQTIIDEVTRMARNVALRATERLTTAGLSAVAVVANGDPKTTILTNLTDGAADYVFVGAHATGFTGFMLGSVARALVQQSPCPVAIIRPSKYRTDDAPGKRILLATDGSESSEHAARSIAERPWSDGTEVRVMSCVELNTTLAQAFEPPFMASEVMQQARENAMLRAQNAIGIARNIVAGANLATSDTVSVLIDKPSQLILQEAERWGADLIVVGSHGRRGWNKFWLGSVSEAVATHALCPVEVIRPRTTKPLLEPRKFAEEQGEWQG